MVNILAVDDEPTTLMLLKRILHNLGYASVTECAGGSAALKVLDESAVKPDIILLDLNMPEMDGVEFVRHLVDRKPDLSIILISAESERVQFSVEALLKAHGVRVLGHLKKPVSLKGLKSILERRLKAPRGVERASDKAYESAALESAIRNGEIVNYYQPKISIATGKVVGVESLARWKHAEDGIVYPDQFIDLAESAGLINDLTRVVLTNAVGQARRWKDAGIDLMVAINVSTSDLVSVDFADFVIEISGDIGVSPRKIILEVTESRLMRDVRSALYILNRLSLKRFKLSIDDFGTGYSSLAQLRDIPFTELKIDKSFVHGVCENDALLAIFGSAMSLGKSLNMEIVTEGVEDMADWDFLQKSECDSAQGNFIAKPMSAGELPAWIEQWERRVNHERLLSGKTA